MLVRDSSKRISLIEVRRHAWFTKMREGDKDEGVKSLEVMNRLRSFRAPKRL